MTHGRNRKLFHRITSRLALLFAATAALAQAPQLHPSLTVADAQTPAIYVTPRAPLLGAAWYPEQWPEARWDTDLALMQRAHLSVVRIGEFAWSSLEPSEHHFELDWLDRAIALAATHHLAVVLGTPTDAPPAWLTTKYPETLGVNSDGHTREHGGRRQFNYADPKYRELCRDIVTQLATRFGHNPAVIGWQIGNEYTDESFDPDTRRQFQDFLRARYGTLENLNQHWGTAYWSQTYTDWSQIPLEAVRGNPGLLLEHKHFVTATWRSFQRNQIDALRAVIDPRQFITTNIGGLAWSDNWDHYAISADLNLASWDDYVGQGHLQPARNAMLNDFVRGWRNRNFWVMETQPGSVNWAPINNALDPGETRALAWQAVGHGADAVLYWQWRAALNGQEQYHGAIVGPDGTPLPLYPEIARLGAEFARVSSALAGTSPQSEIALLHTYDSRWAIEFQPHTVLYDQQKILLAFYEPLSRIAQASGHQVDIIDPTITPLDRYKLLVAPSLNVISEPLAARLLAYVQQGGHLLLGPRSGMKDEFNALNPQRQPGPLASALGARVEQFYALEEHPAHPVTLVPEPSAPTPDTFPRSTLPAGAASIWAEPLDLAPLPQAPKLTRKQRQNPTTHLPDPAPIVLLRYYNPGGWLEAKPAMLSRNVGAGSLGYLGTIPSPDLLRSVLQREAVLAHTSPPSLSTLPDGVELCTRADGTGHRRIYILINHNSQLTHIVLSGSFHALLSDGSLTPSVIPTGITATAIDLPPQGIAVLTLEPAA